MRLVLSILRWPLIWLGYVGLVLLAGTVLGILAFVVFGGLIGGKDFLAMVEHGARNGFLYSGVWAGGVSIVLCFMQAHREYKAKHEG